MELNEFLVWVEATELSCEEFSVPVCSSEKEAVNKQAIPS